MTVTLAGGSAGECECVREGVRVYEGESEHGE